ncbi:UDP-2,3-diacylglucosamine diphosphatase [Pseudaeromonas sp. ZJS20]|uniref:UDP-2,3-diacylglucosamine diphosphatase n=1 Tax=Pseudaeromonas aegiceratis TaxID=3153928 RepID=UPI00390C95A9
MKTLFISDLHLSEHRPELTAAFLRFLQEEARQAEALYILGDLFDFWIGDDEASALNRNVAAALLALNRQGVRLYFVHGNRDFLLGERYARQAGLILLSTQSQLDLYGQRVVVLHGDTLCTDDKAYQRFRRLVHWRWLRALFLALPLAWRIQLAQKIRRRSRHGKQLKSAAIMDVTPQAVDQLLTDTGASLLIHGHTHRPAVHALPDGAQRLVLGDWDQDLWYLELSAQGAKQHRRPIPPVAKTAGL